MSDAFRFGLIRRHVSRLLRSQVTTRDSIPPAPVVTASALEAEPTPAPGPDPTNPARPPLFAVRERAVPGQEYANLLSIPRALAPEHRRAHLLAVHGLMHARQARHEAAGKAFSEALSLNPGLDLAALPTFWDLPRAGCQAAVQAYEEAGLLAQATTLNARLRQSLRPRLLPPPAEPRIRQAN